MSLEQRLIDVFQTSQALEPAPDLWNRVVHSIEEDRRHRARVVRSVSVVMATLATFVIVAAVSIEDGQFGRFIHRPTMEALEAMALVTLLVTLGPAIRRFGRGYAEDLWPAADSLPRALLRLLDVAFYLVGAGYILLSTQFEFGDGVRADLLAEQLSDASMRIGGLLLLFGILHATTLFVLPIVALIDNSTRTRRKLPRWVLMILVPAGLAALFAVQLAIGVGLWGGGE